MKIDITKDTAVIDPAFPPDMHPLFIEKRLLGLVYLANGKGPHKTLVLLHGFPGNEKNLDIAHMLRRGGINVLIFHYSGAWGSSGTYSFGQAYRDLQAVRRAIADEAFAIEHRIDRENVYLAGHSVGGFLTLLAARDQMDFRGFAALAPYNLSYQASRFKDNRDERTAALELFSGGLPPLNGTTAESLLSEIIENSLEWDILGGSTDYSDKKMLLVIAASDAVALPQVHQVPIAEEMQRAGGAKTVVSLPCSHDFAECRVLLAKNLYDWLESR